MSHASECLKYQNEISVKGRSGLEDTDYKEYKRYSSTCWYCGLTSLPYLSMKVYPRFNLLGIKDETFNLSDFKIKFFY